VSEEDTAVIIAKCGEAKPAAAAGGVAASASEPSVQAAAAEGCESDCEHEMLYCGLRGYGAVQQS